MESPAIDRSLDSLHPMFRAPLEAWLAAVARDVPHIEMRVTETRRSRARQSWLYAQGRESPFLDRARVTWTMESRHRWGLAADVAMIRRDSGEAVWAVTSWSWLYRRVPPALFGLRDLVPTEYPHLELRYASEAIEEEATLGLVYT